MALAIKTIAGLILAYLAIANTIPVHFPYGKTVVYKYIADVKAGTLEPQHYASQFELQGLLYIRHDSNASKNQNSYYVAITDLKHGLFNGQIDYNEKIHGLHPVSDAVRVLQDPFMIMYDDYGKLLGVKIPETESDWSRNIKYAIALSLQLDFSILNFGSDMKTQRFISEERTIHGVCQMDQVVFPKKDERNIFVIMKSYEPKQCSEFVQNEFNLMEDIGCRDVEEDMVTSTRKEYEVEKMGDDIVIKKFVGYSNINYLPWMHRSEAHYILTNQTLIFEKMMSTLDMKLPEMNFQHVPLTQNVSYKSPNSNYALHAAPDVTHGRHIVKLDQLMPKLKKMLEEAADYLDQNHIMMRDPEWKHGQTINRLLQTMAQMDPGSLEQVYLVINSDKTQRETTVKNVFLEMLPHVGTTASSLFIRNLIRKDILSKSATIQLLSKLPSFVRTPSEKLLLEMEDFINLDDHVHLDVRKAGILCFSSLIYKTYKPMFTKMGAKFEKNPLMLDRYLHDFLDKVKNEPLYEMKIVYLMALRNIRVGHVQRLLMPIIKKEVSFSERPDELRLTALWSILNVVPSDSQYIQGQIWPILANFKEPLKLRLTATLVLMTNVQNMNQMMNIYWYMVYETNPHLHNYYHTSLKSLASSVSPCKKGVSEMARKILRFTRPRNQKGSLSAFYSMEYNDPKYGHGEAVVTNLFMTERIGLPNMGNVMHISSIGRKMFYQHGIHWNTNLFGLVKTTKKTPTFGKALNLPVADEKVKNLLLEGAKNIHSEDQEVFADIFLFMHGRVIMANHYDRNNEKIFMKDLEEMTSMTEEMPINWQRVMYQNLYQIHVPTDLGMPAIMGTYIPYLVSLRFNKKEGLTEYTKLEIDPRIWRHGEYKMSVYNPIADVWHSVHRVTTTDVAFPLGFIIKTQIDASRGVDLNTILTVSRLPDPKLSVSGVRMYASNHVSVLGDENDILEKHCSFCKHYQVVTKGIEYRKYYKKILDNKDTGLRFTTSIFDCENGLTPMGYMKEIYRSLSKENKSYGGDWLAHVFLALTQQISNDINSPEVGSCGKLLKIEPSVIYPSSEVVMNLNWNLRVLNDLPGVPSYLINGLQNEVYIKADVKGSSPNDLVRSWNLVMKHDLTYDYVKNKASYFLTRTAPGENDLKMQLEIEKIYPEVSDDLLKIRMGHEEVNTKITFNMKRDSFVDTMITVNIKGENSEEQRKKFRQMRNSSDLTDMNQGSCVQDEKNLLFANPRNLVPRTWNCIHDAMMFTEMRKYTVEATWQEVPSEMSWIFLTTMDYVWSFLPPRIRHESCPQNNYMKISLLFPMDSETVDINVFKSHNCSDFSLPEVPIGTDISNLFRDTTHVYLTPLYSDLLPICTIYPKVLLLNNNVTVPVNVPHEWTLLTGDSIHLSYAIFVKALPDKSLDMMMVVECHKLELLSRNSKVVVKIDGNVIENPSKQIFMDGPFSFISRIVEKNDGLVILQSSKAGFLWLEYALTSVSIIGVRKEVDAGLCGYVDNQIMKTTPKLYTLQA